MQKTVAIWHICQHWNMISLYFVLLFLLLLAPFYILHRREIVAFRSSQFGMPQIHNKYQSVGRTVVPDFMFETVIEHDNFAFRPGLRHISNPQTSSIGYDQTQMSSDPAVSRSSMWPDMSAGMNDTKLDLTSLAQSRREVLNQIACFWCLRFQFSIITSQYTNTAPKSHP